jgi:hypothetical protein
MIYNTKEIWQDKYVYCRHSGVSARICGTPTHIPHATTTYHRNRLNIPNQSLVVKLLVKSNRTVNP